MITTERSAAVGVFEDRAQAAQAVAELRRAGFRPEEIGVAVRGGDVTEPLPEVAEAAATADGAAIGALSGGAWGAVLGALATGLVPGVGWVIAGGVLAGIVGGAAVGATAGGLLGALLGLGLTEEEARVYERELRAGRTLVTVKTYDRYAEAVAILRRHGAYEAHEAEAPPYAPLPPLM